MSSTSHDSSAGLSFFQMAPLFLKGKNDFGALGALVVGDVLHRFQELKGGQAGVLQAQVEHGLWTERAVQQEKGLATAADIRHSDISGFTKACGSWAANQKSERQAYMSALSLPDKVPSPQDLTEQINALWQVFSALHERKAVEEQDRVQWYCPRCQIVPREEEVEEGQREYVEKQQLLVKFQLTSEPRTYFLVQQEQPWTLLANVALALDVGRRYVKIRIQAPNQKSRVEEADLTQMEIDAVGEQFILAEDRLIFIEQPYEIVKSYQGKDLVGKQYRPLYSFFSRGAELYQAVSAAHLLSEEGTGIETLAPAFDQQQQAFFKNDEEALFRPLDEEGKVVDVVRLWRGKSYQQAGEGVIEELTRRSLLYRAAKGYHTHPRCVYCSDTLLQYIQPGWHLQPFSDDGVTSQEISIHLTGGEAFSVSLQLNQPWLFSSSHWWGIPIPVWRCESCDHEEIFSSVDDLRERVLSRAEKIEMIDHLHRPEIDRLRVRCQSCSRAMFRVKDIFSADFESVVLSHWLYEKYVAEGGENLGMVGSKKHLQIWLEHWQQLARWFEMNVPSGKLIATEAELGEETLLESLTGDSLRWQLITEGGKGGNTFCSRLKTLNQLSMDKHFHGERFIQDTAHALDQWLLSRTAHLNMRLEKSFGAYRLVFIGQQLEAFVNEVLDWYVPVRKKLISRQQASGEEASSSAFPLIWEDLLGMIQPLLPKTVDDLRGQKKKGSWPQRKNHWIQNSLEKQMDLVQLLSEQIQEMRDEGGVASSQPLGKLFVVAKEEMEMSSGLAEVLLLSANVKELLAVDDIPVGVPYRELETVYVGIDPVITPELQREGMAYDLLSVIDEARRVAEIAADEEVAVHVFGDDPQLGVMGEEWKKLIAQQGGVGRLRLDSLEEYQAYTSRRVSDFEGDIRLSGVEGKLCVSKIERRK